LKSALLGLILLASAGCDRPAAQSIEQAPQAVLSLEGWPTLSGRVVDMADLLTPEQEAQLTRKSEALEHEVGPQYVIVTAASLNGLSIERYSIDLARHWGLGDAKRNDGLMLLVAPNERKTRIEVGTGLERRITDPYAARVIRERAVPRFEQGDYADGIEAATDALIARLRSAKSEPEIMREDGIVTT
jgi:uncharacterized protein